MAKSHRPIRYREIKPKSMDKSVGAIEASKPKSSDMKISQPENVSPTTGRKRDIFDDETN